MKLRNPYTNRSAVRCESDFFGRERELQDIYTRVLGSQSVSLIGERRVGKSSLLNALMFSSQRLHHGVPEEFRFILVDCQYIVGFEEEVFLEYLLTRIAEETSSEIGEPRRYTLRQVARKLHADGIRPVILMDEFDVFVDNERITMDFLSFLRSWSSEFSIPLVIVSREGSIDRLAESPTTGSAFLNIFGIIYIGSFSENEASELVTVPAELAGEPFEPEQLLWILELAGHFPFFLQIACFHLFELNRSGAPPQEKRELLKKNFAYETMPHFEYLLGRLSEGERAFLKAWGRRGDPSVDSIAASELRRKGILLGDAPPRIFSKVFQELVRIREGGGRTFVQAIKERALE